MNNSFKNNNLSNLTTKNLDWSIIQIQMKDKLGLEIYEKLAKKDKFYRRV